MNLKTASDLVKKLDQNYKYLLIFLALIIATAFLAQLGSGSSSTIDATRFSEQTISQNLDQPDIDSNLVGNISETDPEYQELERVLAASDIAQAPTSEDEPTEENSDINSGSRGPEITSETSPGVVPSIRNTAGYEQSVGFLFTFAAGICDFIGDCGPQQVLGISTTDSQGNDLNQRYQIPIYNRNNLLSALNGATLTLIDEKPGSVQVWAQDLSNRLNPVDTVVAQDSSLDSATYQPGPGFSLLSPILPLWQATSNLVYLFYIVIIIVIAFLIVFRSQLDGQNAVSVFNAIPSIIISIILVYFSYPLSAIFIDLITVGSGVSYGILVGNDPNGTAPGAFLLQDELTRQFVLSELTGVGSAEEFSARTGLQIDDTFISVWRAYDTAGINTTTDGVSSLIPSDVPLSNVITNLGQGIIESGGANIILTLIFTLAAFSASVRLFFAMLGEYLVLFIYPIIAPFIFLSAALPGRTGSVIASYFRRLLACSLTFIGVYAGLLLVVIIARQPVTVTDVAWTPPLLGYSGAGNEAFLTAELVKPLIGYALFISLPLIPDAVKQLLNVEASGVLENIANTTRQGAGQLRFIGGLGNRAARGALGVPEPQQQR